LRDSQKIELPAEELVVGDIVFVKIGDKTPAGNIETDSNEYLMFV